jgi:hypothetical protein
MRHNLLSLGATAVLCAACSVLAPAVAPPANAAATSASTKHSSSADFPHPLLTTSRYFPLTPGRQLVFEGTVQEQGSPAVRHTVVFTVTDLVKVVDGFPARVILDLDYNDGVLAEAELAFFAQDKDDNVWTRGEYPEEYESGTFVGAPSVWISGVRGAVSGILVPGDPRAGTPVFVQGRAPAIGFFDVGQVTRTGLHVCVPTGCYDHVVEITESAPLAPEDGNQLKYYAPNVGLVKVTAQGGDKQETLRLSSTKALARTALDHVRDAALRLDRRGYQQSKDYRKTGPAYVED